MTDEEMEFQPGETDEEMAERLRPLVNDILETFNERQVSPAEVGMVVLSLTYRLLEVLKEAPEARRHFVLTLINLINNYLADELQGDTAAKNDFVVQEDSVGATRLGRPFYGGFFLGFCLKPETFSILDVNYGR